MESTANSSVSELNLISRNSTGTTQYFNIASDFSGGTPILNFWTQTGASGGSSKMVLTGNGNVGIGTTSPGNLLKVNGGITIDGANSNNGTTTNMLNFGGSGEGIASKRTTGANQWGLDFYPSSANRMAINAAGNVGIGISSPGAILDVAGVSRNIQTATSMLSGTNNSPGIYQYMDVSATGHIDAIANNPYSTGLQLRTYNNGTYNTGVMINSVGNVGVGSDAPAAKLDVAGDLKVSGKYFGSKSGVGYIQPATWSYSFGGSGTTTATLWSGNITVPQDSIIQVTLGGHWEVSTAQCYMSVGIDDVSVAYPGTVADTACYGWAHTYSTVWENIVNTGYAKITASTHKLSVMGMTFNNTCYLNGARISYMYFPQ